VYVERAVAAALTGALENAGAVRLDQETADAVRIEAGIPKFGAELNADTIPLEAGLESTAISFTKGCYVGQVVIIRVLHRGHGRVARKLAGIAFADGRIPPRRAAVTVDGRDVGIVTSSTWSPALARPIALAYLHRDFLTPGAAVRVEDLPGEVAGLPFVASSASAERSHAQQQLD
jgi:folate-binding protein YgfZ